jgi:peptidoglycan L-alanyl-D-glutamate endopeptidase CwlK
MVFGVFLYFVLVTAVFALLFLAPVRAWSMQRAQRLLESTRTVASLAASSSHSRIAHAATVVDDRGTRSAKWMQRHGKWVLLSVAVMAGVPLLAIALRGMQQLDGFDHTASRPINEHIAALLHGEQLVPPPALPPEMFTTREVEQARPFIGQASRQWELLDEDFRQRMLVVFKIMREQHGYEMVLLEGYRSPERQTQLASLGSQVTQAGAFESYHQFGLAADCAFVNNGRIVVSEADPWAARGYDKFGEVARSLGLTWGGGWRSIKDLGHVELPRAGVLKNRNADATPPTKHAH